MPTGFWDSLNPAARFLEWMQPKRVLDIGIGSGRMGFLAREYGDREGIARWRPGSQIVDGIEGYAPYLGPIQEAIYDHIFVGEALSQLTDLDDGYELVIASDILEHFSGRDGLQFLDLAAAAGAVVMVITPNFDMPQQSVWNPLENHRSFWPPDDLRALGARLVSRGMLSTFALLGDSELIDAYKRYIGPRVTWKDWLLPPEVKRTLGEQRRRLHGYRKA